MTMKDGKSAFTSLLSTGAWDPAVLGLGPISNQLKHLLDCQFAMSWTSKRDKYKQRHLCNSLRELVRQNVFWHATGRFGPWMNESVDHKKNNHIKPKAKLVLCLLYMLLFLISFTHAATNIMKPIYLFTYLVASPKPSLEHRFHGCWSDCKQGSFPTQIWSWSWSCRTMMPA